MKRGLRIMLCALLCALCCLSCASCESGEEGPKTIRIGFFIYKGADTFISNLTDCFNTIASEYEGEDGDITYTSVFDARESQATQNEQIKRAISLGYDVLCVNLVDRTEAAAVIDLAREADIPMVFFNREPVIEDLQRWDRTVYVGTDARSNAELEGSIVVDAWQRDPRSIDLNGDGVVNYIMIEGERRHQDALIRTEVSVQYLKENGMTLEKLDGGMANWVRSQGAALAEQYFGEYGDSIELFICNNDDMALGVTDTVQKLGLDFHNIVGIDGTPAGLEAVRAGRMLGTVVIGYREQAQLLFDAALDLYSGIPRSEFAQSDFAIRAPLYIVTKDDPK